MNPKLYLVDMRRLPRYEEAGQHFLIEKMVNSVDYRAGDYLTTVQVNDLIKVVQWTVTIRKVTNKDV